jgi:N-methylhydantoinase A
MRYSGQRHPLHVALSGLESASEIGAKFRSGYLARYGSAGNAGAIEFVALRVTGIALTERPDLRRLHRAPASGSSAIPSASRSVFHGSEIGRVDTPIFTRTDLPIGCVLEGPAVIEEFGSTTVIGPRDVLRVGELGEMWIDLR